uniref:BTB domain-containing protein n=1 Tax=Timema tahoe TaxID=61484 RepID=A0A7R9FH54_9NEOP|nr:unnamed protein product [Timema tahoe]
MAWASITYPEHPSTLVAAVSTYYEQESYMDVSFMCAGLERVEAHRLVLTSVSPFMKTLLMEYSGPEPPVISLPDVSQHLLRLVLQFLYDGVMKVNQDELAEFKNILTVLGIKVPNATVVKLNERIPAKLNPSKDTFVRRPPKRPSPVARSRSPALVAVPPPTPSKVTNVDPSDDPLNVPDFYFRPQPSQPETADATVGSAAAATATPIIEPDPMPMDDEEEEEAAALEVPVIPVSRSSVTPQTSPPTINTSRRSTRSSVKPATPQPTPQRPPSPEVLIKVEREDEEMSQSNSSLVNTNATTSQPLSDNAQPLKKQGQALSGCTQTSKKQGQAPSSCAQTSKKQGRVPASRAQTSKKQGRVPASRAQTSKKQERLPSGRFRSHRRRQVRHLKDRAQTLRRQEVNGIEGIEGESKKEEELSDHTRTLRRRVKHMSDCAQTLSSQVAEIRECVKGEIKIEEEYLSDGVQDLESQVQPCSDSAQTLDSQVQPLSDRAQTLRRRHRFEGEEKKEEEDYHPTKNNLKVRRKEDDRDWHPKLKAKKRRVFAAWQNSCLKDEYLWVQRPTSAQVHSLSEQLGLSEKDIKLWFRKHRRNKKRSR